MKRWLICLGLPLIVLSGCSGTVSVQLGDKPATVAAAPKSGAADAVEQMFEALNATKAAPAKAAKTSDKATAEVPEPARQPQVFEAPADPPARAARKTNTSAAQASQDEVRIDPIEPTEDATAKGAPALAAPVIDRAVSEPAKPSPSASIVNAPSAPAVPPSQPATPNAPSAVSTPSARALKIASLVACSRIEAFGRYTAMDMSRVRAGRPTPMLLYTEIEGFTHRTAAGLPAPEGADAMADDGKTEWVVELTQKVTIRRDDKWGTLVQENVPQLARDVSMRRRRDHYLVQRITLPATLAPGAYVLTVEVADPVSRQTAQQNMPITVLAK